jgi:hypothetical protein
MTCGEVDGMIRIRQPAINFWGGHQLSLALFEIYGTAKYDPISSHYPKPSNVEAIREWFWMLM